MTLIPLLVYDNTMCNNKKQNYITDLNTWVMGHGSWVVCWVPRKILYRGISRYLSCVLRYCTAVYRDLIRISKMM